MLSALVHAFEEYRNRVAFHINNTDYTYGQLKEVVISIQNEILARVLNNKVGIITNDDIETYAAILAILFSGKAYIPIDPKHPDDRNTNIIEQAGIQKILCSDTSQLSHNFCENHKNSLVTIQIIPAPSLPLQVIPSSCEDLAYILFTSGSTGMPKGVPIQRKSLQAFVNAFKSFNFSITSEDRFLQVFDLTFDLSIFSYLIPLLYGASVYTIPKGAIRYAYAFNLLEEHQITIALSVPSFLYFLKPYFSEIKLPSIKYWFFCGEALNIDILKDWQSCIPNAQIENVYGPTEATIFCTRYPYLSNGSSNKSFNGILSIGKPFPEVGAIIINESLHQLNKGETGELCLSGAQVTPGYINNDEKNKTAFFHLKTSEGYKKYYRTGDLCFQDQEGDFLFTGRLDAQIKIQGFRVELGEIENVARVFDGVSNAIGLAHQETTGNTSIHLFIEPNDVDDNRLIEYLRSKLPHYMLPKNVYYYEQFPLNINGKIDKQELKKRILA